MRSGEAASLSGPADPDPFLTETLKALLSEPLTQKCLWCIILGARLWAIIIQSTTDWAITIWQALCVSTLAIPSHLMLKMTP